MKCLSFLCVLIFSFASFANNLEVGCNEMKLLCPPGQECLWLTNLGQVSEIQLTASGSGPDYELSQGRLAGFIYNEYPFEVILTQKLTLSTGNVEHFLNIKMKIDENQVESAGKSRVSARYRNNDFGIGIICTTELNPESRHIE